MRSHNRRMCVASLCAAFAIALWPGETANAMNLPYDTYNYDYREYIHFTPAAYVPSETIGASGLSFGGEGLGGFLTPQDLCQDGEGRIYVADTGNNRVVVLDRSMEKVEKVIAGFENNGVQDSFRQPYGVCVSKQGWLYVADSQNNRVVVLDQQGTLRQIVEKPVSESLEDGFVFTPLKVAVDYAGRVYVIAQNMFEGIMVFESDGNFASFFGTIDVKINAWDKFWSRLATKEERANQMLYIPTEFTGIDIDPDGFVYASNIDASGMQGVRRLNPRGEDVIKKGENQNVGGDLWTDGSGIYAGASQFVDVVHRQNGIYSCLDRLRGRIFTYDHEGNLLYIFGGLGTQAGTFTMPVAVEDIGGELAVLDATRGQILTFQETEYGRLINEAVSLRYEGDETAAVELWGRVLELDENNELANSGIGKAYMTAGDYKSAMKYLKLGMDREYYSVAFRRYRNAMLEKNAGYALTALALFVLAFTLWRHSRKKRGGAAQDA